MITGPPPASAGEPQPGLTVQAESRVGAGSRLDSIMMTSVIESSVPVTVTEAVTVTVIMIRLSLSRSLVRLAGH